MAGLPWHPRSEGIWSGEGGKVCPGVYYLLAGLLGIPDLREYGLVRVKKVRWHLYLITIKTIYISSNKPLSIIYISINQQFS